MSQQTAVFLLFITVQLIKINPFPKVNFVYIFSVIDDVKNSLWNDLGYKK